MHNEPLPPPSPGTLPVENTDMGWDTCMVGPRPTSLDPDCTAGHRYRYCVLRTQYTRVLLEFESTVEQVLVWLLRLVAYEDGLH